MARENDAYKHAAEFRGTKRFELRQGLGSGGMGTVYRAYDRERDMEVALKVLSPKHMGRDAAAIMRFKGEFRSLADVAHPNLVALYELLFADPHWFFTMELVTGIPFRAYVHGDLAGDGAGAYSTPGGRIPEGRDASTGNTTGPSVEAVDLAHNIAEPTMHTAHTGVYQAAVQPMLAQAAPYRDVLFAEAIPRLRRGIAQLAEGLVALHRSGYLHCDIKPSNILVVPGPAPVPDLGPSSGEGDRVVLIDFGLVTKVKDDMLAKDEIGGTPVYMSPEQARGIPLTEATDWFSVGVMLYRMLSGTWPRPTNWIEHYEATRKLPEPIAPHLRNPELPEDLSLLCMALLREDPAERPSGLEILHRLGATPASSSAQHGHAAPAVELASHLLGRQTQLATLDEALAATGHGTGQVVYVRGAPGMGKTTLVLNFLDKVAQDPLAVILRGRCYQQESVPYKALDSLIDSLCQYMTSLLPHQAWALIPDTMSALARVFPVLERVLAHAGKRPSSARGHADPQELRRQAALALRELLTRIGERCLLVVFIDDLQWGDVDSAAFFEALLRPPDAPRLLLVATYRIEDHDRSPLLRELFRTERLWQLWHQTPWMMMRKAQSPSVRVLDVGHLSVEEATALARALLAPSTEADGMAATIARESGGDPLFIHELAQYVAQRRGADQVSLADVVRDRLLGLSPGERRVIELVAAAGRPLPAALALAAGNLDPGEQPQALHRLRTARLLRTAADGARGDQIEIYHDRIREIVVEGLSVRERQSASLRLAQTLEASRDPDAESLAVYYQAAGDHTTSARYALMAGRRAAAALSFARAAELYEQALTRSDMEADERRQILIELGEMHQAAGHGRAAAAAFLGAAKLCEGLSALDLQRRAAGEEMRSGHIAEGLATMAPVLAEVGVTLPTRRTGALTRLLYWRGRLRMRGLHVKSRDAATIPASERLRMATCLDLGTGLANVAPLLGSAFTSRALFEALVLGDRETARSACLTEISLIAALGKLDRAAELATLLDTIASTDQVGDQSSVVFARAMLQLFSGHFAEAYAGTKEVLHLIRSSPERMDQYSLLWRRDVAAQYLVMALLLQIDVAEMARAAPEHIAEADKNGNLYTALFLRVLALPTLYLHAGEPDKARREIEQALAEWNASEFQLLHFIATMGELWVDLSVGDGIRAWKRCQEVEPMLRHSLLLHIQLVRCLWRFFSGMAALEARASGEGNAGKLLRQAERNAHALSAEGLAMARYLGTLLGGNIAAARGNMETGRELLLGAAEELAKHKLPVWAAMVRWGVGKMLGGSEGRELIRSSEPVLTANGTTSAALVTRTLVVSSA